MNLAEFISKENIPSVDGIPYQKSDDELLKEKLEDLLFMTDGVPQLNEETDKIIYVNWLSSISVIDKWNRKEKKNKRKFFIFRSIIFEHDNNTAFQDEFEVKDEMEAIEYIIESHGFQNFLKYNKLIFDGRYLMNFNFKRVIYLDGKIQSLDGDEK